MLGLRGSEGQPGTRATLRETVQPIVVCHPPDKVGLFCSGFVQSELHLLVPVITLHQRDHVGVDVLHKCHSGVATAAHHIQFLEDSEHVPDAADLLHADLPRAVAIDDFIE